MTKINDGYLSDKVNYNADLCFAHCGIKENEPNELCGPMVRNLYLLHFVIEGKGRYFVNNREYHLKKGDVFAIYPNDVVSYIADEKDPWYFCWIGFVGTGAPTYYEQIGFKENSLVKHLDNNLFLRGIAGCLEYINEKGQNSLSALRLNAFVLEILSAFQTHKATDSKAYVDNATLYMEMNYNKKTSPRDVAKHIGLEYSYFYRIFKGETGYSPAEYLINLRIEKSKKLLDINTPIKNIPDLVGVSDVYYFTKLFKKHICLTPAQYLKQQINIDK